MLRGIYACGLNVKSVEVKTRNITPLEFGWFIMKFKNWLISESSLKDLLEPVPQNPKHHEEGNVFKHTMMVRKSLEKVKPLLQEQSYKKPFENINFNLSEKEEKILKKWEVWIVHFQVHLYLH